MKSSIVATLSNFSTLKSSVEEAALYGANMIELRLDAFSEKERTLLKVLLPEIRKKSSLEIIATVRDPKEQGLKPITPNLSDEERLKIFESVLTHIDWIDIELEADTINKSLVKKARLLKKGVILSYHDFKSIPSEEKIKGLLKKFHRLKGDIFKVAATPKTEEELLRFLTVASHIEKTPKVFIAMGELGQISRTKAFSFGSCLTYGHIGKPAAPGQVSINELVREIRDGALFVGQIGLRP